MTVNKTQELVYGQVYLFNFKGEWVRGVYIGRHHTPNPIEYKHVITSRPSGNKVKVYRFGGFTARDGHIESGRFSEVRRVRKDELIMLEKILSDRGL